MESHLGISYPRALNNHTAAATTKGHGAGAKLITSGAETHNGEDRGTVPTFSAGVESPHNDSSCPETRVNVTVTETTKIRGSERIEAKVRTEVEPNLPGLIVKPLFDPYPDNVREYFPVPPEVNQDGETPRKFTTIDTLGRKYVSTARPDAEGASQKTFDLPVEPSAVYNIVEIVGMTCTILSSGEKSRKRYVLLNSKKRQHRGTATQDLQRR